MRATAGEETYLQAALERPVRGPKHEARRTRSVGALLSRATLALDGVEESGSIAAALLNSSECAGGAEKVVLLTRRAARPTRARLSPLYAH